MSGYLDSFGSLYFRPALSGTYAEWPTHITYFKHDAQFVDDNVLHNYGSPDRVTLKFSDSNGFESTPPKAWNKNQSWYCNTNQWGESEFNGTSLWINLSTYTLIGPAVNSGALIMGIRPSGGGTWHSGQISFPFSYNVSGIFNWYELQFDIRSKAASGWHTPEIFIRPTYLQNEPVAFYPGDSIQIDAFYLEYKFGGMTLFAQSVPTSENYISLFAQQYETLTSGIPLYGSVATNSELELPLMNKAEDPSGLNSNFPLFSKVYLESSGELPFYLDGIPYSGSSYFPIWMSGQLKVESPLPLYSLCIGDPWHYRDLYTSGNYIVDKTFPMYASGFGGSSTGVLSLYVSGPTSFSGGIPFYTEGPTPVDSGIPLYSYGEYKSEKGLKLVLQSADFGNSGLPIYMPDAAYSYTVLYESQYLVDRLNDAYNQYKNILNNYQMFAFNSASTRIAFSGYSYSDGLSTKPLDLINPLYSHKTFDIKYASDIQDLPGASYNLTNLISGAQSYSIQYYFRPRQMNSIGTVYTDFVSDWFKSYDSYNMLNIDDILNKAYAPYKGFVHFWENPPFITGFTLDNELILGSGEIWAHRNPIFDDIIYDVALPYSVGHVIASGVAQRISDLRSGKIIHPPFFNMFAQGFMGSSSGQFPIFTKVSINGEAGVRDDDLGINLYVPVSGVKSTKGITLYSFNSGVPQSIFPLDRSITLFTSNPIDTYAEDGIPLVTRNNTTGVYSGIPLLAKNYRTDISIFDPLYYELEDGGVPYSQGATLYTRQTLGEIGLPLYVGTGTQVVSGVVMFNQARSVGASVGGLSLWNSALAEFGDGVDFYGHGF